MNLFIRVIKKLELFEMVGILGTLIALYVFFRFGHNLDAYVGVKGYHWDIVGTVVLIYAKFIPWALLVGVVGLVLWFRRSRRRVGRASPTIWFGVRVFLAYCLLLIAFRIVNFYVPYLSHGIRDTAIQRIDASIFFGHEVGYWLEFVAAKWLTYLLSGVYYSWFWFLFFTIAVLLIRSQKAASEYVFASLLAFYMGYLCYVLVPVIGPGYTIPFHVVLGGLAPNYTLDTALVARDCFPSLHTAITVVMLIYVGRHQPRWLYLYAPIGALIIFATLYLRYHYGLDDIAGASLGIIVSQFAPGAFRMWDRVRNPYSDSV